MNDTNSSNMLIIDDDIDDHEILTGALKNIGYTNFKSINNGLSVIQFIDYNYLQGEIPKLILLDYNMPGVNGEKVLQQLKHSRRYHHIPVIIYSSHFSASYRSYMQSLGAFDCLAKAENYEQLKAHALFFKSLLRGPVPQASMELYY